MIRTDTVLIVGAGASSEFKFPLGGALLQEIATNVTFGSRSGYGVDLAAPRRLFDELQRIARGDPERWGPYGVAANRIIDAAPMALSIDNVIHQNSDSKHVEIVGKVATAEAILRYEKHSALYDTNDPFTVPTGALKNTWMLGLGQLLTTDVERRNAGNIFDRLRIITFNYDRTIERALPFILTRAYGMNITEAQAIIREKLRIYHPYGQVGSLEWWPQTNVEVGYGRDAFGRLNKVIEGLKTFSESLNEADSDIIAIRDAAQSAQRLIFIGFGFHDQNMALLRHPKHDSQANQVLATVYGEATPVRVANAAAIKNTFWHEGKRSPADPDIIDLPCNTFMWDYRKQIAS